MRLPEEKFMHKPWLGDMSPTNTSELVCVKAFFKVGESHEAAAFGNLTVKWIFDK